MPIKYILASSLDTIEAHLGSKAAKMFEWEPKIVVSQGDKSLIITQQNPDAFTLSAFGMTPSWAKRPMQLINARAEGDKNPDNDPSFKGSRAIFLKPAFQKPIFTQRCIVIADAFIESSSGVFPTPHLFYLRDHRHPIGFAGLYDLWKNPVNQEQVHSFTIITTVANSLVRGLPASRMPVILPYGRESQWLKPTLCLAELLGMLTKYPSKQMNAYPISGKVNQQGPFTKKILTPQGARLLSETQPPSLPQQSYYGHKKRPGDNTQTFWDMTTR
jgi:putative SOS response-associated peptidase YedK